MEVCGELPNIAPYAYQDMHVWSASLGCMRPPPQTADFSAITSTLHDTILRVGFDIGQHIKLSLCWYPFGQLAALPSSQGQWWLVCVCFIIV